MPTYPVRRIDDVEYLALAESRPIVCEIETTLGNTLRWTSHPQVRLLDGGGRLAPGFTGYINTTGYDGPAAQRVRAWHIFDSATLTDVYYFAQFKGTAVGSDGLNRTYEQTVMIIRG